MALAWNMQRGAVVITKADNLDMAKENLQSTEIVLTDEEMKEIEEQEMGIRCYPSRVFAHADGKDPYRLPLYA